MTCMMIGLMATAEPAGMAKLGGDSVQHDLFDMLLRMGSEWVLWLLLGLSILAVALAIERLLFYLQERRPSAALQRALAAIRDGDHARASAALAGQKSIGAAVVRSCIEHAPAGVASVEEHMLATIEHERGRYERGLAFLGTLGNNAPFIGLFGTVLGIIRALSDLAGDTSGSGQAVMEGIAEALVTTCIGLAVALPAVAVYNACARHVERVTSGAEGLGHTLLGYLKSERGAGPKGGA